ncbi:MAG: hypothetical protein DDG58_11340 [Ardenticatenia bacterium]|nr:MAG: hypothetical protein DDG58_11340 [Ardenticatenia bacterium]
MFGMMCNKPAALQALDLKATAWIRCNVGMLVGNWQAGAGIPLFASYSTELTPLYLCNATR